MTGVSWLPFSDASRNPDSGRLAFEVSVTDGAEPKAEYTFRHECTAKESGKLDRVRLERSGRSIGGRSS